MTRYFAQNTPRAGLEHMMMSVPGFQKRGGGMMILSRFCYKPEDVDCRYCLHYRRRSCQVRTCPYIAERLKSGAIEYERVPDDPEEYGKQVLERIGADEELISTLDGFTDFEAMGNFYMREDGVRRTEFGLLRKLSDPFPEVQDGLQMH